MELILFIICFGASCIGSVTGIGGGVMIKPLTDMLQTLSVEAVSFLSGCTVFAMSAVSIFNRRKLAAHFDMKRGIALAVGSAAGGVTGKFMFQKITLGFDGNFVLVIQSVVLAALTAGVFIYMLLKRNIRTYNIENSAVCCGVGLLLGIFSAFLGIGGGPINLMILNLLFSMDAKTAAGTSLFIIFISQLFSLIFSAATNAIPEFSAIHLAVMTIGGIAGGFAGSAILKRITVKGVEYVFLVLLWVVIILCMRNVMVNI